ncbi:helix-turn-helix domain protein [Caldithrix abyssi DSM 13497]|uniref:Helix-turn-helix domain protein n=2 Tax=Caldithrix abyssi DSM 13497 TaxID=880073 RepID=H1XTG7_CALAY|nr:helix-turn-helix transcriptional regulator [Caldithrix abyssi]EHO40400.1 helix-turn-helix domain protein [Caldithrix abyssi DSM 13497]
MVDRLNILIKKLGLAKKDFAKSINVSPGNLSDWLKGKSEPSSKALIRICEIYNVNLNWLLTGQGNMFLQPSPPPTVNEHAQAYQAKEQEIERLKQEITNLKAELKKMDQEEEKDKAHLQALQAKIRELELENRELIGQIKILKELLLKKA